MKIRLAFSIILFLFLITLFFAVKAESKDVITADGGIAASWVLTGAFIVIGSLITFIIYDMKRQFTTAMNSLITQITKIEQDLENHSILHGRYDEKFKTLFKELSNK